MALNILMTLYVEQCQSWNFEKKLLKTVAKTFGWIAVPKMFLVKADSKENVIATFYKHYCNFREETFLFNLIKIFY